MALHPRATIAQCAVSHLQIPLHAVSLSSIFVTYISECSFPHFALKIRWPKVHWLQCLEIASQAPQLVHSNADPWTHVLGFSTITETQASIILHRSQNPFQKISPAIHWRTLTCVCQVLVCTLQPSSLSCTRLLLTPLGLLPLQTECQSFISSWTHKCIGEGQKAALCRWGSKFLRTGSLRYESSRVLLKAPSRLHLQHALWDTLAWRCLNILVSHRKIACP